MRTIRFFPFSFLLMALISVSVHAAQVANYEFQNTLASSGPSAPSLIDLGTGVYVSDTVSGQACTVFAFEEGTGLSLDITGMIGGSAYTFVAMLRLEEVYEYIRILDIHNGLLDEGLYAYEDSLLFYDYSNLGLDLLSSDTWAQVALTFDGSTLRGYVNGVLAFSELDDDTVGGITSNTLYFFLDDEDENSAGRVANIQLYDETLSGGEIGALSFECDNNAQQPQAPVSHAIPTMPIYGLILTTLGLLLVATRRLRISAKRD